MTDLLVLAAFMLSFLAFARTKQANERFTREIAALQADVARLSAERLVGDVHVGEGPALTEAAGARRVVLDNEVAGGTAEAAGVDGAPRAGREGAGELLSDAGEETAGEAGKDATPDATGDMAGEGERPSRETFESQLGARWAVWVGGIALALGGIFLVKVSIDAGLLSPAVRLMLAALFGLALMASGEAVRRRASPDGARRFANAMIPGILTAAGAVTLLGAVFAAHAVYGFIGPTVAFLMMAVVSLSVLGLSLLHGQALAGLGLAASLVTPLLVDVEDPAPWSLFAFLTLVWLASLVTARLCRWRIVPALSNFGLGLWGTIYLIAADPADTLPVSLSMLVLIAGLAFVWPADADEAEDRPQAAADGDAAMPPLEPTTAEVIDLPAPAPVLAEGEASVSVPSVATRSRSAWRRLLLPRHAPVVLTGALTVMITALSLIGPLTEADGNPTYEFVLVTAALALLGAFRRGAVVATVIAGITAVLGVATLGTLSELLALSSVALTPGKAFAGSPVAAFALAGLFIAVCAFALHRHRRSRGFAILSAGVAAMTSVACVALSFLLVGAYGFDLPHGLGAVLAALALLGLAEGAARRAGMSEVAVGLLLAGALGHAIVAAHALTNGLWTVLLMALAATAFVAVARFRRWPGEPPQPWPLQPWPLLAWPALPWITVLGLVAVLARIGWEPTIVGPLALGRTPVFNALLPGYGIPTLLALWCAYTLRDWPSDRLRNAVQAIASLFCLLTLAILVRHAMNGGQLEGGLPTLSEQSIYTLLFIGASGILLRLDLSRPEAFFRYGGMALGVVSILMTLSAHLFGLNPYLTGEMLGPYPVVDLLLIGYLLPGLAYAALARMAVGRRPQPYVAALATASAILVFAWATLSVRRAWQGQGIADWKGFLAGETYSYSVVWLLLGVLLLVLSLRFHSRSMRIASAVLVFVTVLKVFLFDMANLEGLLRALSFMGLGVVLIGIGLFYQKVLGGRPKTRGGEAATAPVAQDRNDRSGNDGGP